jgi:hypothetical protein
LPHLRFRPISDESSLVDFYNLFLSDQAQHSFLVFHKRNGDTDVKVGKWRDVRGSTSITVADRLNGTYQRSASVPSPIAPKLSHGAKLSRSITFTTKISNDAIPIGVTNTQTLSMAENTLVLESRIVCDEGAFKGMGFLISSDVRGSEVCVRVVLREGDGLIRMSTTIQGKNSIHKQDTILESPEESSSQQQELHDKSFFSCFSHPLLLPPDSLCGVPSQKKKAMPKEDGNTKHSNSFVDIHGEKHLNQDNSHAHVGASLLSAIKAKNSNGKQPNWPQKTFNNRFDEMTSPMVMPEHTEDVLRCSSSRGELKLKPLPSFELSHRAPSNNSALTTSEGHLAMRRMILEKDGAMTSTNYGVRRSSSTNSMASAGAYKGLAMRITMDIHSPSGQSGNNTAFSRSKGSFALDTKILKGLKKRVSRTWISWAESWCMRLWEEEESNRIKCRAAYKVDGVSRKRKTNVRPTVRRIGEKRDKDFALAGATSNCAAADSQSAAMESKPAAPLNWNAMDIDSQTKWTFVRQSSETSEEEECGVEVACALKVARTSPKDEDEIMVQKLPGESKQTSGKKEVKSKSKSRWNRSPQVKKRIGR